MTSDDEIKSDNGEKILLKRNTVYVRIFANNSVSSSQPRNKNDWEELFERCFHNREYEIASFFKRNLDKLEIKKLATALGNSTTFDTLVSADDQHIKTFMKECELFYTQSMNLRDAKNLLSNGTWGIGAIINGTTLEQHKPDNVLMNLLNISNPRYTGWPSWVDSRNFAPKENQANVKYGAWEALIISSGLDFWRIDPQGKFFLLRVLEDDSKNSDRSPIPMTKLEFGLTILRISEAVLTALAFAKAMGYQQEAKITFGIKLDKLKDRELSAWANPRRYIESGLIAVQDDFSHEFEIGLNFSDVEICQKLYDTINSLFHLFKGYSLKYEDFEYWFNSLTNRKLREL